MTDRNKLTAFCALCFADEHGGSWNHATIPEANFCTNCGAGGSLIQIPEWAVKSIRNNASWVGKRFYPTTEDHENHAERLALLQLVQTFPGRDAHQLEDGRWEVTQRKADGTRVMTWVAEALNDYDAMQKSKLPYVPQ